jgi:hypothetical protein
MARGVRAAIVTSFLLAFAVTPTASAAPQRVSQKIFADLADNGRLDGHYTRAQINRALHTPPLESYDRPASPARPKSPSRRVPPAADEPGSLPFSGLDLALFGGVGGPLLLLGASMGRLTRLKAEES